MKKLVSTTVLLCGVLAGLMAQEKMAGKLVQAGQFTTGTSKEAKGLTALNEGFEGETPAAGWTILNADNSPDDDNGPTTWGIYTGEETAPANSGTQMAGVAYNEDESQNNDWLITPVLTINADNKLLKYFAKSYKDTERESMNLMIKDVTAGGDYVLATEHAEVPGAWTEYTYDLSSYIGHDINVAFQYVSTWMWYLFLDDISLSSPSSIVGDKKDVSATLAQNYPNPFNPETTINFALANQGKVALTVYNAKGEMVTELVNEVRTAGNHSVKFNAAGMNSGVYFYKLTTPETSMTQKMLLVK